MEVFTDKRSGRIIKKLNKIVENQIKKGYNNIIETKEKGAKEKWKSNKEK